MESFKPLWIGVLGLFTKNIQGVETILSNLMPIALLIIWILMCDTTASIKGNMKIHERLNFALFYPINILSFKRQTAYLSTCVVAW